MTHKRYIEEFEKVVKEMVELTRRKNSDYASGDDAFQNFKLIEHLGVATAPQGFVVRMSDKLQRISNLLNKEAQVKDEQVEDTLKDLAVYSILLMLYLQEHKALDKGKNEKGISTDKK